MNDHLLPILKILISSVIWGLIFGLARQLFKDINSL